MRQLTALELLVEWEHLPSTTFVAIVTPNGFPVEFFQWLCVQGKDATHLITEHVKLEPSRTIALSDDPYNDFDIDTFRTCRICFRRLEAHLTTKQVDEIVSAAVP